MPTYDLVCEEGHKSERFIPLERFEEPILCACNSPARRVISAPMIRVENVYYDCPITGKPITSLHAHEENLSRHDCRVLESGEAEANQRVKADAEASFERSIDDSVERAYDAMPGYKREQLANELMAGADISVERGTAQ